MEPVPRSGSACYDPPMPTQETTLRQAFASLRQYNRGGHRAPHKPLLLLYALATVQRGGDRLMSFEAIRSPLERLLREFGRPVKGSHAVHDPFWRLQGDGNFWVVPQRRAILDGRVQGERKAPQRDASVNVGELLRSEAKAGFTAEVDAFLRRNPEAVNRLATELLDAHFPATLHESILDAVGMHWTPVVRKRSPDFRAEILRIYQGRCVVCGYDGRLGGSSVGVQAAHIQWHSQSGPDVPSNGLALCALHHVAFDRGAFSLTPDHRVLVSQHYVETSSTWLSSLHHNKLPAPVSGSQDAPAAPFITWHRREVFQAPGCA